MSVQTYMGIGNTTFILITSAFAVIFFTIIVYSSAKNYVTGFFERILANGIENSSDIEKYETFVEILREARRVRADRPNKYDFKLADSAFYLYLTDEHAREQMRVFEKEYKSNVDDSLSNLVLNWRLEATGKFEPHETDKEFDYYKNLYRKASFYPAKYRFVVLFLNRRFITFRDRSIKRFSEIFELMTETGHDAPANN